MNNNNNIMRVEKVEAIIVEDNILPEIDLIELDLSDNIINSIKTKTNKYIINEPMDIKLHILNDIIGVGYVITKIDNSQVLYI